MSPSDRTPVPHKLQNFRNALAALQRFVAEPNRTEAAEAGIVQGLEFTFEQCGRLFQSVAQEEGLEAASPKAAISAALKVGLVQDERLWLQMLDDRNLSSHTYRREVAVPLVQRIEATYLPELERILARMETPER